MAKYDWKQLEKEYILSNNKSINEFLKSKNIKYNGNARKQTQGWTNKKVIKEEQKSNKIIQRVTEKEIEKEVDINTRHLNLYNKFLDILEQSFKNPEQLIYVGMPDFDKLKKMIEILEKAQKGQRIAKGLDNDKNVTQSLAEVIQQAYQEKVGEK